jgi:2-iminobutanoate/2-iminopropanoate deaminase
MFPKNLLYNQTRHFLKASVSSHKPFTRPLHTTCQAMSAPKTHESLTIVSSSSAPAAIGPYSQAIKAGDLLFCSGCIPLDAATGEIITGGVEAQTEKALANLKAVVEAGGSELGKVVKTTVSVVPSQFIKPLLIELNAIHRCS